MNRYMSLIFVLAVLSASCTMGTRFEFDDARKVQLGMTTDQLSKIMGKPLQIVRNGDGEEWLWKQTNPLSGYWRSVGFTVKDGKVVHVPFIAKSDDDVGRIPEEVEIPKLNPVELVPFEQEGTGSVKGSAMLRQISGAVITCAGTIVTAYPKTEFSKRIVETKESGKTVVPVNSYDRGLFAKVVRSRPCNALGEFEFSNLPAGTWYVDADVSWRVPGQIYGTQGGTLRKEVIIQSGKMSEVYLGGDDLKKN